MKLLLVSDAWSPQVNGVVYTLQQTCRELTRLGHDVEVIQPGLFHSLPCPSYPEIRLSMATPGMLHRLIESFSPDAVHISTEGPLGLAARRSLLRRKLPFTSAYHTRFPEYLHARTPLPLSLSYRLLQRFHSKAVRTMVPTPGIRQELIQQGFDASKLVVWPRGVNLSVFHPEVQANDAELPHTDTPVFLYAGRVAVEKNLEAFLSLDLPGEKWVVGGGPALESLQTRYPQVRFFGPQPHDSLPRFYRRADVFVFPSQTDTFGLVLLEAMACGCPIAALPSPSTQDVLSGSKAGVVDQNLRHACLQARSIPRAVPLQHAQGFSWAAATETFFSYLQPFEQR